MVKTARFGGGCGGEDGSKSIGGENGSLVVVVVIKEGIGMKCWVLALG